MTDRELLEFAAKAASNTLPIGTPNYFDETENDVMWNPLEDDGDALQLVVKLGFTIQVDDEECRTYVVGSTGRCIGTEPHGDDPYAATRGAIVRAAAEIGREME